MNPEIREHFEYLFEEKLLQEIELYGVIKEVKEGDLLLDIGQPIVAMPLILSGAIKILREDEKGDELNLYFIEQGDTCAVTLTCCMNNKKSEIRAVAEVDTKLVMIPIQKMGDWMSSYKSWQNFILQSYNERLNEMLEAIDNIAFLRMDERLHKFLKDKAKINRNQVLQITHQDIANDLHTSRVVISRLLKALENDHKIELNRNQIKVLDF
jgi:CRP/FNR family transcriptional regulator